jgi:hypothetical protein
LNKKNSKPLLVNTLDRRQIHYNYRRPFWFPASSYYILTVAITIAVFFLIWGILIEGGDENPWILAGISASVILGGAVFLREVILNKARQRYLLAERQLDYNLKNIPPRTSATQNSFKLGIKKNAEIVNKIKKQSEAAKTLGYLPDAHWEVFEMCNKYLAVNKKQLATVGAGSPRIAALRRGKEIVENIQEFHLLTWTEIESRSLTEEALNQVELNDKIELTQRALMVVSTALEFYPNNSTLKDSNEAIKEFIASIKVSHWIEQAERHTFKKDYKKAVSLYKDALFYLARENIKKEESVLIAEKINMEIDKIREIENELEDETPTLHLAIKKDKDND